MLLESDFKQWKKNFKNMNSVILEERQPVISDYSTGDSVDDFQFLL